MEENGKQHRERYRKWKGELNGGPERHVELALNTELQFKERLRSSLTLILSATLQEIKKLAVVGWTVDSDDDCQL